MTEEEFSTIFLEKDPILTITHGTERLCGKPGVQSKNSSTPLEEKNQRPDALKKVRVMVLPSLHHPFPKVVQLSDNRDLFGP